MKKLTEEQKQEIDNLSHLEMCRAWRFGKGKKEWFNKGFEASSYFHKRLFEHFGGFTPQISKQIGW